MEVTERNSLFDGDLICEQHIRGYRFSIDAVLLAHFTTIKKNNSILDLGTGSGIIALILLYRHKKIISECSGLELQKSLFDLAGKNMRNNCFEDKCNLYHGDVKDCKKLLAAGSYDTIVCNPPFYPERSGRINQDGEARIARHQISANLNDFLRAASYAVKNKGTLFFIYPADLLSDFSHKAKANSLEIKKLRFIYSYPSSSKGAQLVLIHCSKNGGQGMHIAEPLYINTEKNGKYSSEIESYYLNNSQYSSIVR